MANKSNDIKNQQHINYNKKIDDRIVFFHCILFTVVTPAVEHDPYSAYCSDEEFQLDNVRRVLEEMNIDKYSIMDCLLMREICKAVSTRAACLAAAGMY